MLTHSEQIDQLASALADAQADIGVVFKQSRNDAFGSRYADLARVWEAFQRVGPRHGLSVVQMPGAYDAAGRTMSMSVRLMHNSGQWLGGDMSMPLSRGDAHAYGSACTYARRYSLAAIIGICPHDDDGNAASGVGAGSAEAMPRTWRDAAAGAAAQPQSRPLVDPNRGGPAVNGRGPRAGTSAVSHLALLSDPQGLEELRKLAVEAHVGEGALCRHYRVGSIEQLSPRDAARAKRALGRKIEAIKAEAMQ